MKKLIYLSLIVLGVLYACTSKQQNDFQSYVGTFEDENGVRYELRADSTTLLTFSDSITYEGTWKMSESKNGQLKFANIEFGGYQRYFYVMNGKIYHSEREMRHDVYGSKLRKVD